METVELYERTVQIGGYEYDDGNVHVTVMPRRIRIREFTDSQIELRMLLAFMVGLIPFFALVLWTVPHLMAACN